MCATTFIFQLLLLLLLSSSSSPSSSSSSSPFADNGCVRPHLYFSYYYYYYYYYYHHHHRRLRHYHHHHHHLLQTMGVCDHIYVSVIIIIIFIIIIAFMQRIYNYMLETMFLGYVLLQLFCSCNLHFMLNVMYFYISTLESTYVCSAQYGCFCSSLNSRLPDMSLRCCLNDFEMVPVATVNLCFYIPHALDSYCKVYIFQNLLSVYLNHISVSWNCNIY